MHSNTRTNSNLLPRVRVRERPKAKEWNQIAESLNRQNTGVDVPIQIPNIADDQSALAVQRFRIKNIQGDFLVCVSWNGVTEGEANVSISRPFLLRTSLASHNSVTFVYTDDVTRTASAAGETDETQVIVPAYVIDDQILAIRNVQGGLGAVGDTGKAVVWEDINIDARAWAKQA